MTTERSFRHLELVCEALMMLLEFGMYGLAGLILALLFWRPEAWPTVLDGLEVALVCAAGARIARRGLPPSLTQSGARLFRAVKELLSSKEAGDKR